MSNIKRLEWDYQPHHHRLTAMAFNGYYTVTPREPSGCSAMFVEARYPSVQIMVGGGITMTDAQHACNDHHQSAVQALLDQWIEKDPE